MGQSPETVPAEKNQSNELIQHAIKGRGIAKFNLPANKCLCQRPYTHIICLNCGHLMFGRVRYKCPKHVMITFLIDITNCPKCKSFEYMLNEFEVKSAEVMKDLRD